MKRTENLKTNRKFLKRKVNYRPPDRSGIPHIISYGYSSFYPKYEQEKDT